MSHCRRRWWRRARGCRGSRPARSRAPRRPAPRVTSRRAPGTNGAGSMCRGARRARLAAGTQGESKGNMRAMRQGLGSWRQKSPPFPVCLYGSMLPHSALVHCAARVDSRRPERQRERRPVGARREHAAGAGGPRRYLTSQEPLPTPASARILWCILGSRGFSLFGGHREKKKFHKKNFTRKGSRTRTIHTTDNQGADDGFLRSHRPRHKSRRPKCNSETACSRVADESVRVPPRVAHSFSPIHKLTLASLKRSLNP